MALLDQPKIERAEVATVANTEKAHRLTAELRRLALEP